MPRAYPPEIRERVAELLEQGLPRAEAARRVGVSEAFIRKHFGKDPEWAERQAGLGERKGIAQAMRNNRVPYARISRSVGVSQSTLQSWFGPSPIAKEESWTFSSDARTARARARYEEMVRLRMRDGLTNREIAERLGVDRSYVWYCMGATPARLGGRKHREPGLRERARYLRECGYSVRDIAEKMGLPRSTVGDWVNGMPCG